MPDNESYLRAALATALFAHTAQELDQLNHDEASWEKAVVAFTRYRQLWQGRGVLPMLRNLIGQRKIAERLLRSLDGERQLTDLLHVGELLQQASQELDSDHALVRWLSDRIAEPNGNAEEQQVRLESERELVQIVTIHKSKGLEYPFVMLPFICSFRGSERPFYHDEQNEPVLALNESDEAKEKAEQERLAEDLRLLYVALTRAVYGCFAGIAPLKAAAVHQRRRLPISVRLVTCCKTERPVMPPCSKPGWASWFQQRWPSVCRLPRLRTAGNRPKMNRSHYMHRSLITRLTGAGC